MSGTDYLLDSSILIDLLEGDASIEGFVKGAERSGASFFISQITRIEILANPEITPDEEDRIHETLKSVKVLPISRSVEEKTIELRRQKKLKLPDSIIAATAMAFGHVLVTRDGKFARAEIDGLLLETSISS